MQPGGTEFDLVGVANLNGSPLCTPGNNLCGAVARFGIVKTLPLPADHSQFTEVFLVLLRVLPATFSTNLRLSQNRHFFLMR